MPVTASVNHPRIRPTTLLVSAMGSVNKPGRILFEVRQDLESTAKDLAQEVRDAIYTEKFPAPALSRKYLRWKIRKGLDPRKLIATKKYVRSIQFYKTDYGGYIGVKRGDHVTKYVRKDGTITFKRIPYWKLQRIHEYGLGNVPARPVWRPIMREWKQRRRDIGLRMKYRVGRELRSMIRAVGMNR